MRSVRAMVLLLTAWVSAAVAAESPEVNAFLERGRQFYERKDYPSAIKTWSKVLDLDPSNEQALGLIEDARFQMDYEVAVLDRLKKEERLKTPYAAELSKMADEMMRLMEKAKSKIESDRQQASSAAVEEADAGKLRSERQASIRAAYERGRSLYDAGDREAAFAEWEKIIPVLPEEEKLRAKLAELRAIEKQAVEVRQTPPKAVPPSDLLPSIAEVEERVRREGQVLDSERSRASSEADARRARVTSAAEKGAGLSREGRYEEALEVWTGILPDLYDAEKVSAALDRLRGLLGQRRATAAGAAPPAVAEKPSAGPILAGIEQAMLRFEQQRGDAQKSAEAVRQEQEGKQKAFIQDAERADALARSGDLPGAIAIWRRLSEQAGDPSTQAKLASLEAAHREWESTASQRRGTSSSALPDPATLRTAIERAEAELKSRSEGEAAEAAKTEASLSERRRRIDLAAEKGAAHFREGRIEQAVEEWGSVLEFVDGADGLRQKLELLRADHRRVLEARDRLRKAEEASAAEGALVQRVTEAVSQASVQVRSEAEQLKDKASQQAVPSTTELQRVQADLHRASELYESGRIEEAIALWEAAATKTRQSGSILLAVARLKESYASLVANQELFERESQRAERSKMEVPQEVIETLQRANQNLAGAVADARKDAQNVSSEIDSRKSWVEMKFREGKLLYDQGKYSAAISIWESLEPFLRDDSRFRELISEFKSGARELHAINQEATRSRITLSELDHMMKDKQVDRTAEIATKEGSQR